MTGEEVDKNQLIYMMGWNNYVEMQRALRIGLFGSKLSSTDEIPIEELGLLSNVKNVSLRSLRRLKHFLIVKYGVVIESKSSREEVESYLKNRGIKTAWVFCSHSSRGRAVCLHVSFVQKKKRYLWSIKGTCRVNRGCIEGWNMLCCHEQPEIGLQQ